MARRYSAFVFLLVPIAALLLFALPASAVNRQNAADDGQDSALVEISPPVGGLHGCLYGIGRFILGCSLASDDETESDNDIYRLSVSPPDVKELSIAATLGVKQSQEIYKRLAGERIKITTTGGKSLKLKLNILAGGPVVQLSGEGMGDKFVQGFAVVKGKDNIVLHTANDIFEFMFQPGYVNEEKEELKCTDLKQTRRVDRQTDFDNAKRIATVMDALIGKGKNIESCRYIDAESFAWEYILGDGHLYTDDNTKKTVSLRLDSVSTKVNEADVQRDVVTATLWENGVRQEQGSLQKRHSAGSSFQFGVIDKSGYLVFFEIG
eukprot:GHVS01020078.1.p1 GENE.GHVS01020078.1~~GHVS01020078.1.p1  ORF type:complete len:322 (-),score=30.53 GHVS01020078.1:654-1619(-)